MTPQEHAKQARILYESLSRREHLVNRERFESIVSDHIQRALDEQAALLSPAPAATVTDDWAVNAMKRIDGLPKPARESWSVLSWEEYYKECARIIQACCPSHAQGETEDWAMLCAYELDSRWPDLKTDKDVADIILAHAPVRRRLPPPAQGDEMRAVVDALVSVRDYYEQKVEDWEDCESCGNLNELCPEHGLMYALLLLTDPEQDADFTPYALRDAIAKAAAVTYSAVAAVREGSG